MKPRAVSVCGLAMLTGLALSACAGSERPPLIDRVAGPDRVRGDRDEVSVEGGRLDSLPLAVAHCARFGRAARFSRATDGRTVYACIVQ